MRKPLTAVAVLVVAAFSLTSCGQADSPHSAVPRVDDPVPITVFMPPVYNEANYIALEQGFYADHGLEVTLVQGTTADAALAALANGSAQIAGSSGVATITAASRGVPVRIIDGITGMDEDANSGIFVRRGSGIESPSDLTGKTVAINGLRNTTELLMRVAIDEAEGDSESTSFVEMPYSAMNQSLAGGVVDGIYQVSPFSSSVEGDRVENPSSRLFAGVPAVAWVMSEGYSESNPAVVDAYSAAMAQAYAYANDNPEAVRDVLREHTEMSEEDITEAEVARYGMTVDRQAVSLLITALMRYGFIDDVVDLDVLLYEAP